MSSLKTLTQKSWYGWIKSKRLEQYSQNDRITYISSPIKSYKITINLVNYERLKYNI